MRRNALLVTAAAAAGVVSVVGCGGGGGTGGLVTFPGGLLFEASDGVYRMNVDGSNPVEIAGLDNAFFASMDEERNVVYAQTVLGESAIFRLPSNGGAPLQLTNNNPARDTRPVVSPDGTKIVFVSDRDGNDEIYIMDSDGSNQTRLTNDAGTDYFPSISHDGTKIVFTSDRDGNDEVYIMDADGGNLTRLTNNPAMDTTPAFSPSGSQVIFTSDRDGNGEIYRMNADGSNQVRLTNTADRGEYHASYRVNGSAIFFYYQPDVGDREIARINFDGAGYLDLTTNDQDDGKVAGWVY